MGTGRDGHLKISVLTLFPEWFRSPLQTSIFGRAVEAGNVAVEIVDIRDFAEGRHRRTDDRPYGGGAGMVLKPGPVVRALEYADRGGQESRRILLTPQGEPFRQEIAEEWSTGGELVFVCGRYEGVDERVREGWIDREISVGDYVLSGGEPAAAAVMDAVVRLIPGVLGNENSVREESFTSGGLEYPQYTRPRSFRGRDVPEVLLSGDHGRIAEWRERRARERTERRRPDLVEDGDSDEEDD
jgi:tRNA (guanine37-N1)-methyltransferase